MIFLIPPSEGKNKIWEIKESEKLFFVFEKPLEIAEKATEKDLKCTGKRYEEAIFLNKNILNSWVLEAIKRYDWVMFSNIDFENMTQKWQNFFQENFLILSWMYWILKSKDKIWNYKLPARIKWLYNFWWNKIFEKIVEEKPDFIINLLPSDYEKMLNLKKNKEFLEEKNIVFVNVNFLKEDWKKLSHWVKVVKWKWIKEVCEKWFFDLENKISKNENIVNFDIFVKKW